jgi:hypothetical protein
MTSDLSIALARCRALRRPVGSFSLLTKINGGPYQSSGFDSAWQRMMTAALAAEIVKERFTFHDIRAKGLDDREEQGLNAQLAGGHPDPAMTARYIRSKKGRKYRPLDVKIVEDAEKL